MHMEHENPNKLFFYGKNPGKSMGSCVSEKFLLSKKESICIEYGEPRYIQRSGLPTSSECTVDGTTQNYSIEPNLEVFIIASFSVDLRQDD